MVNTILKEADLFCPNSVRINFTIYLRLLKCWTFILRKLAIVTGRDKV
ncbi:ABC transporter ATP-binding protein [Lactiplantibacillus plantarum]|nr:ABC transporter ATP-binding protein [Lactiplantibacillus plantarum]